MTLQFVWTYSVCEILKTMVIVVHNCEYVIATIIEINIRIADGHFNDYWHNQNYHDLHNCW